MTSYEYIPQGVCPTLMKVFIDEDTGTLRSIAILGGCHGYLTAMLRLLKGKPVQEAIEVLSGIKCGNRDTSCPDQMARALKVYIERESNGD